MTARPGLVLAAILIAVCQTACGAPASPPPGSAESLSLSVRQDRFVMGTMAQIEVHEGSAAGIADAFAALKQAEEELAIWRKGETPLRAEARGLSEDFRVRTGGAFDARLAHLVRLWGWHADSPRIPTERELADALALPRPSPLSGTDGWDFGGIGKGMAASRAARALADSGALSALVNLGGNIQSVGAAPGGGAWRIGIRHPRDPEGVLGVLQLEPGFAAATSGDYERFVPGPRGERHHHILDPATGRSASRSDGTGRVIAVTVVAPDAATADAWSTAAFVLGWPEGRRAIEAETALAAVFTLEETGGALRTVVVGPVRFESADSSADAAPRAAAAP